MEVDQMLEGFICPICKADYKGFNILMAHYEDQHSDDAMLLKTLKNYYEKAKKKVMKKDQPSESDLSLNVNFKGTPGYQSSSASKSSIGFHHDHTAKFKSIRALRIERYTTQSNNLLIRLGKLLENLPSDPLKRKAHEQLTVPWMDEKDVRLCPGCAKHFGILRRKHHCRLCGAVMCNDCSHQLPIDTARKMASSVLTGRSDVATQSDVEAQASKKVLRSPSSSSVQSVLSMDNSLDTFFRLCEPCHTSLLLRDQIHQVRTHKPIICQFYDKLRAAMDEVQPLLINYAQVHNSLSMGETIHTLNDGHVIRVKILRLAETIDSMSKKISVLGQNTDSPPQGVQHQLQTTVRTAAAQFLKEHIIGLQNLPTEEQLRQVQDQRRLDVDRKIEEKKRFEGETELRSQKTTQKTWPSTSSPRRQGRSESPFSDGKVNVTDAWTPAVAQTNMQSEDPIIEQINNIQAFIKQARVAGRTEEVETLETNLRELRAFWKDQQEPSHSTTVTQ